MTKEELRSLYKLKKCKNPEYTGQFWRVLWSVQFSDECWANVGIDERLSTHYFSFCKIEEPDGLGIYSLTVWRLKLVFGFV